MMQEVPEGFELHFRKSPMTDAWEPIYSKRTETAVILGLRAREPHLNSRGMVHGGLISTLADNAMGLTCGVQLGGARLLTVNLSIDFVDSASAGQWIEIDTVYTRTGKSLCFAQAFVKADGMTCARANAVFRALATDQKRDA